MKKLLAVALIALGFVASGAKADPIGPNCPSCFGSIYTLEYSSVSATEYLVRLIINSAGYNAGPLTDYIQGVAIKPASSILASSSLVSTTAPGGWGTVFGSLSNGCTGSGSGWLCVQSASNSAFVGSTYEWIFDIHVANAGDWLLAAGAASVQANYDPHRGIITSEPITLQPNTGCCQKDVPEPHSLALVGLALFGLFAIRRRYNT